LTERSDDRDDRLGRAPDLLLADPDRETERTLGFCRAAWVRDTDGEERRLVSRRTDDGCLSRGAGFRDADGSGRRLVSRLTDDGRRSRGAGVEACLADFCREGRSRETSSWRERGLGADVATRSALGPGPGRRLDACDEGRDDFFPPDLGFDREPPLAFGLERDGFEGLAREGSDRRVGFVGLAREGSDLRVGFVGWAREGVDLPRGVVALGRSRVCRGLAIFR
jgi:hypothetical protein